MKQYNMDDTLRAWKTLCVVALKSVMRIVANVEDVLFFEGGDVVLGALLFLPVKIKLNRQENH